jgi:hypothetical protein
MWQFQATLRLEVECGDIPQGMASNLSPQMLIEIAELLMAAGYKVEAKQVLGVVLLFPPYAQESRMWGPESPELTANVIAEASRMKQSPSMS